MAKKWKLLHRTLKLKSSWVTVFADVICDNEGHELEYWHYDRADSAIVIAIQNGNFLLPQEQYRVGVDQVMLDFAGSRIGKGQTAETRAFQVLEKELGIPKKHVKSIQPILDTPLAVDSSFSSQKLHGFIALIEDDCTPALSILRYPITDAGKLRATLHCAQCRLVLDEHLLQLAEA